VIKLQYAIRVDKFCVFEQRQDNAVFVFVFVFVFVLQGAGLQVAQLHQMNV